VARNLGNKGFTLVEVLVALFIVSVAIVFVSVAVGTTKVSRDSTYENFAFRIANNKLDELRAVGYAMLPESGFFTDPGLAALPQGVASTSVTNWNAKTKKVVTSVSWTGTDGLADYVSMTTLITESGGL